MKKRFLNLLLITGLALSFTGYTKTHNTAVEGAKVILAVAVGGVAGNKLEKQYNNRFVNDFATLSAMVPTFYLADGVIGGNEMNINHLSIPATLLASSYVSTLLLGLKESPMLRPIFDRSEIENSNKKDNPGELGSFTRGILSYAICKQLMIQAGLITG